LKTLLLVLLIAAAVGFLFFPTSNKLAKNTERSKNYPEVAFLKDKNWSFGKLSDYFSNLAYSKGAEYAYEVLKIAPLPANTDTHLLGHVVGDVLYKQQGVDGIKICTQDFRNACSHSIVVGLFSVKGEKGFPEIIAACKKAPGGKGAYAMCFHGLGHGVLSAVGYDPAKAAPICEEAGNQNREATECLGGMVMELIGGGAHDPGIWAKERALYLTSKGDPLSFCKESFIPEYADSNCYNYLTPYLFEAVGGNQSNLTADNFAAAFKLCLPITDPGSREGCFGGFGKEFVVLAENRDIRNIGKITEAASSLVRDWCDLANDSLGTKNCLSSALSSIYWGGENDKEGAIRFCQTLSTTNQDFCYAQLINNVGYYITDGNYRKSFCGDLPDSYHKDCTKRLVS